jgi:glycosyltransferase involved in cell wall biosynthesis
MYRQNNLAKSDLHYFLDSLVIRAGVAHGHGWAFPSRGTLRSLKVELSTSPGCTVEIAAVCGFRRDDVAGLYADVAHAQYSGFRFQSRIQVQSIQSAWLVIETEDGKSSRIQLNVSVDDNAFRISTRKFAFIRLAEKAWRLVRQGQFGRLRQAVSQYATRVPRRQKNLISALEKRIKGAAEKMAIMVIDHDLGGGANMYRERLLAPLLKCGESVLVLSFFMPKLQYVLEYRHAARTERFALSGLSEIISLAESGLIREVFYNNAVSFHDPGRIPELLLYMKNSAGIPFRLAMHDYFCICPSHYLLNSEGRYCDLPSTQECNRCLSKNTEDFVRVAGVTDIVMWRTSWASCLQAAEEIIFFSEATRAIFIRAYPDLPQHNMVLRPHKLDYIPQAIPRIDLNAPLHIGLLGNITKAKGAEILHGLSEEIIRRGLKIPITVIGSVDAEYQIPSVHETGRYTTDTLPQLVEQSGVNLFLFPSILPETFSYVIAELIALDVPVVCFDFGAPAERVSKHHLGRIIPIRSPSMLLDELLSFHAQLSSLP